MAPDRHDAPENLTTLLPPRRKRAASIDSATPYPALTVLAHPNPDMVGARARLDELSRDGIAKISRLEPGFRRDGAAAMELLGDPNVSRKPVVIRVEAGDVVVDASKTSTTVVAGGASVQGQAKFPASVVENGLYIELADRIGLLLHWYADIAEGERHGLIGDSVAMRRLRLDIGRVADASVPILIRGETGTGKERVAQALHQASPRAKAPFVAVNMATVPPTMAASQLFGHARGAFSGADRDHQGFFAQANGGTLFLDEIGEIPAEIQPMLLRVLEDSIVQPLGSANGHRVDVRVIAATDADLDVAVSQGEFRAPLLHRLAGYQIFIPPLRQRIDDLGRLLYHFLEEELAQLGEPNRLVPSDPQAPMWLSTELLEKLVAYPWPGNVRELRNVARRLALLGRGRDLIQIDQSLADMLGPTSASPTPSSGAVTAGQLRARTNRGEITDDELLQALARNNYQTAKTARELGISKATLYQLMAQCPQIRTAKELTRDEIERWAAKTGGDTAQMAAGLRVSERGLKLRMTDLGM